MKRILIALVLIGTSCSPLPRAVYASIIDRVSASIVRITFMRDTPFNGFVPGICSGFVVAPDRVLSANHCIGTQVIADGAAVKVIKIDPYYDLALLQVSTHKRPLAFRDAPVLRFESVTGIGYAFGWTRITTLTGLVFLVDQMPTNDRPPGLAVQGGFVGGMSGGPIIDSTGRVVGIVQESNEGVGYGVGVVLIRAFLLGLL